MAVNNICMSGQCKAHKNSFKLTSHLNDFHVHYSNHHSLIVCKTANVHYNQHHSLITCKMAFFREIVLSRGMLWSTEVMQELTSAHTGCAGKHVSGGSMMAFSFCRFEVFMLLGIKMKINGWWKLCMFLFTQLFLFYTSWVCEIDRFKQLEFFLPCHIL